MKNVVKHSAGRDFYDDGYDNDDSADDDSAILGDSINFTSENFCGREQELQQLLDIFRSGLSTDASKGEEKSDNAVPLVMVSGRSGSGKSCLVDRLVWKLREGAKKKLHKPFFRLQRKFEKLQQDPMSAIVDVFNRLGDFLVSEKVTDAERQRIRESILSALGDELDALLSFFPGLVKLVGRTVVKKQTDLVNLENVQNQLHYLCVHLVKAACIEDKPVILFLDDIQWMDVGSLNLLLSILKDRTVENFMVIGAYQSEAVGEDHVVIKALRELERQEIKQVVTLNLPNWSLQDVEGFLSRALDLDVDDDTRTLAAAIYGKTRGNALFTRQAIEELHRKEFLFYSRITFRWEWNEKGLEQLEASISNDVLDAIVAKIHNLPSQLQRTLVVASFTRSGLDKDALLQLVRTDKNHSEIQPEEMTDLLEVAVLEGILSNRVGSSLYKFRHDSFREAARSLVPRGAEQTQLKQQLAHQLYNMVTKEQPGSESWMIYVAADHLNSITVTTQEEWIFRAQLNAKCGKEAFLAASLRQASRYFQAGVDAIREVKGHWKNQYELTLSLFRGLSAVTFALGYFDTGRDYAKSLLLYARSFDDKIPTYMSMTVALGRQDRHLEALQLCQTALALTGDYPRGSIRIKRAFWSVKQYFRRHDDDEILSLPAVTDKSVLTRMALHYQVCLRAVICGQTKAWLGTLSRQLELTVQHGLCGFTPMAFAFFAIHLNMSGRQRCALRAARLARALIEGKKYKRQEGLTRYILGLHVDDWHCPSESVLSDLEAGGKTAVQVGDMEAAFCNWAALSFISFMSGCSLPELEEVGRGRIEEMQEYHEQAMLTILKAIRFPVVALTGRWRENGEVLDWDNMLDSRDEMEDPSLYEWTIHYCLGRLSAAIYFRRFDVAKSLLDRSPSLRVEAHSLISSVTFYRGLQLSGQWQEEAKKQDRHSCPRRVVHELRRVTQEMKRVCSKSSGKMRHRLLLLETELLVARTAGKAKTEAIMASYEQAISVALQGKYLNDAALASEFAGEYFRSRNQEDVARSYLQRAVTLYERWGARAKVEEMQASRASVLVSETFRPSSHTPTRPTSGRMNGQLISSG